MYLRIQYVVSFFIYLSFFVFIPIALGSVYWLMHHECIDFSLLSHQGAGSASVVLDEHGIEWARFESDRKDPIALQVMPQDLINAFVAAEDWHFFSHHGISWKGILRSVYVNLSHRRLVQGASTITQQLVKFLFLDAERTFYRKIKEQCYSFLIETKFSKGQILQAYLNHVYFGCGIYGVQAAAKRFWKKNARDLTVEQCATLAGIVQSPCYYCPITNPAAARMRRNVVLNRMKKCHFISSDVYEQLIAMEIGIVDKSNFTLVGHHAREYIRQILEPLVGKHALYSGGLTIKTTINKDFQSKAEMTFKKHIKSLRDRIPGVDGGIISIEPQTGAMKAIVGGYDFMLSKFNRVFQAKRQIGSVFKPIVYAAAIEKGKKFFETEVDEPFVFEECGNRWAPRNYNRRFAGQISLAYALKRSNNIVAIKLFLHVGASAVIDIAKRAGLHGPFYPYPSLALGCVDATLVEVVGMFNIFAHNGIYEEPYLIAWVKDKEGKKIVRREHKSKRVISAWVAGQVSKVLESAMDRYYSLHAKKEIRLPWRALGKTGTTNDSRTCWFSGATPELTTSIYIGCDDNRSMGKDVYPLKTAFPLWLDFYQQITHKQSEFVYDSSLKAVIIDEKSGKIATDEMKHNVMEIFV